MCVRGRCRSDASQDLGYKGWIWSVREIRCAFRGPHALTINHAASSTPRNEQQIRTRITSHIKNRICERGLRNHRNTSLRWYVVYLAERSEDIDDRVPIRILLDFRDLHGTRQS